MVMIRSWYSYWLYNFSYIICSSYEFIGEISRENEQRFMDESRYMLIISVCIYG